ncbi:MAG: tail fiber protein [Pseudosphingobacterium sp.]|nr:tail fiber protein [Olivibacter sp. UJ_SKK_5.1]MDX3915298.1 tail fiber protein [Pseudosphingobacterium sp.]
MAADPLLSEIMIWAPNFAPRGWAFCQGQLLAISSNSALFALLGTTYGGNGTTTFALPDLQGRAVIGQGQSPGGSNYTLGQTAGTETITLTSAQMPMHTHPATFTPTQGAVSVGVSTNQAQTHTASSGNVLAAPYDPNNAASLNGFIDQANAGTLVNLGGVSATGGGDVAVGFAGGNIPFNIMQPYQVLNFVIALQGVFPSRE